MPYELEQRFLIDCLSHSVIKSAHEENPNDHLYIYMWDYLLILSFLYETGAIIGHAMRDKRYVLERIIAFPMYRASITEHEKEAADRLQGYRNQFSKEPDTFHEFIFYREIEAVIKPNPLKSLESHDGVDERANKAIMAYAKRYPHLFFDKVLVKESHCIFRPARRDDEDKVHKFIREGMGFGSAFPELIKIMNMNYWESVRLDMDRLSCEWAKKRLRPPWLTPEMEHALPPSLELMVLSFEEQEQLALRALVAHLYLTYPESYPESLNHLDLQPYSPQGKDEYEIKRSNFNAVGLYADWFEMIRFISLHPG